MSTRTVLVTGAGRGIGRAIAVCLARSGWRVYGGVRTDVAAKELAEESDLITPVELDVTVPDRVVAVVERELDRRRMRPRTLVGRDARTILAMRTVLPTRGLDAVWARGIGV